MFRNPCSGCDSSTGCHRKEVVVYDKTHCVPMFVVKYKFKPGKDLQNPYRMDTVSRNNIKATQSLQTRVQTNASSNVVVANGIGNAAFSLTPQSHIQNQLQIHEHKESIQSNSSASSPDPPGVSSSIISRACNCNVLSECDLHKGEYLRSLDHVQHIIPGDDDPLVYDVNPVLMFDKNCKFPRTRIEIIQLKASLTAPSNAGIVDFPTLQAPPIPANICMFWVEDKCKKSADCSFIHAKLSDMDGVRDEQKPILTRCQICPTYAWFGKCASLSKGECDSLHLQKQVFARTQKGKKYMEMLQQQLQKQQPVGVINPQVNDVEWLAKKAQKYQTMFQNHEIDAIQYENLMKNLNSTLVYSQPEFKKFA
jgi:hypothetical protein